MKELDKSIITQPNFYILLQIGLLIILTKYCKSKYQHLIFRLQKSQDIEGDEEIVKESEKGQKNGSVLNLSQAETRDPDDSIRGSDSDIGEPDIDGSDEEMDYSEAAKNGNEKDQSKSEDVSGGANMFQMMNQIQSIIKMTVEKAKQEEKNNSHQKCK